MAFGLAIPEITFGNRSNPLFLRTEGSHKLKRLAENLSEASEELFPNQGTVRTR